MKTMYPLVMGLMLMVAGINWWFLTKWFPKVYSRLRFLSYCFVNGLCWLIIGYSWIIHPGTPFFYQWITPLLYLAFVWVVGEGLLLLLFPVLFAVRRVINYRQAPSRRSFLKKVFYSAPAIAFAMSSKGVYSSNFDMEIRHLDLSFHQLPPSLKGFKIAQISDTHLGPFFTLERLDYVLALIKKEQPDMLVITGDMIDDLNLLPGCMEKLSSLSAMLPQGIYFCWGNHEYFRDIERIRRGLLQSPIHILENSNVPIVVKNETFYLLGVDYPWAKTPAEKIAKQQAFLREAQENIPDEAFRILLSHHPDFIADAFALGIPLTLSGHTHGGQINIAGRPLLPLKYRYMRGLYQENHNYGYVSVGTGQWFPLRMGCPPEINIFTLG